MSAMQIIVPKSRMNTRERRNDRCDDLNHQDRHSDFWLFIARSITFFVLADISIGQLTIGH